MLSASINLVLTLEMNIKVLGESNWLSTQPPFSMYLSSYAFAIQ